MIRENSLELEMQEYDPRDELIDPDERGQGTIEMVLYKLMRPDRELQSIKDSFVDEMRTIRISTNYYTHAELIDGEFATLGGRPDKLYFKIVGCEEKLKARLEKLADRTRLVAECMECIPPTDKVVLIDYYQNNRIANEQQLSYAKQRLFSRYVMEKQKRTKAWLEEKEDEND